MGSIEGEEPAAPSQGRRETLRPAHGQAVQAILFTGAALLGLTSLISLAISIWAHIVALTGNDPRLVWNSIWVVLPLLVAVLAPIGVITMRKGVKSDPFGLPRFAWRLQVALMAYYGAHFYLFLYRSQTAVRADHTWQMFSAGLITLFGLATAIYLTYLRRCLAT